MPAVFYAPWDDWVRMRTILYGRVALLGTAGLVVGGVVLMPQSGVIGGVLLAFAGFALLATVGSMLFFMPVRYIVTEASLDIILPLRTVRIPRGEITDVRVCTYADVFADGTGGGSAQGMFGLLGHWYGAHLPEFLAFATRRNDLVVLTRRHPHPAIVVTPDDTALFTELLQRT